MRFIPKVLRFTIAGAVLAWPLLAAQRFEISFPQEASAAPLDGHVMLVISTQEKPEPRFQLSFTRQSQQAFDASADLHAGFHLGGVWVPPQRCETQTGDNDRSFAAGW